MRSLDEFLDPADPGHDRASLPRRKQFVARKNVMNALKAIKAMGCDPDVTNAVVDCDSSNGHWCLDKSPCLTASRASGADGGHWVTSRQRRLRVAEMAKLMGVAPSRIQNWDACPALTSQMKGRVIGNSVPVPLLVALLRNALPAAGLL